MEIFLKYFAGPLLAAIFTTTILWFKESKTENKKHLNNVMYEQLTKVYNKLFILYYKYNRLLEIRHREEVYSIQENDEELTRTVPYIEDDVTWNKVIEEVKEIIYPNIHLLMRNDVILWNEFLTLELKEVESEEEVIDIYIKFKSFFKETSISYIKLYNNYHLETKVVNKTRKEELKKKVKNIKNNPLLSKEIKRKKIRNLKREEKEITVKIT